MTICQNDLVSDYHEDGALDGRWRGNSKSVNS